MPRLKISLPLVLAGLCAAALTLEIVFLRRWHTRATRSCAALEQRQREQDRLLSESPPPTREGEETLVAAVGAAARTLAALRDEIGGSQPTAPIGAVEAYFELNRLVEAMRRQAAVAQVEIKASERFGFASYANQGPTEAVLPAVLRQRRAAGKLIESLLEARPLALLGLRRERPGAASEDKSTGAAEDYFALPREHSLRVPGILDTDAFRMEFTGTTAVLRRFLSTIAGWSPAVVVRTVEVEPVRTGAPSGGRLGYPVEALQRLQISKFTVTLEVPILADAGGLP